MSPGAQYSPGQELPGTVYRVIRHLATGGMGSVYDVEDTSVEKRYVLKTLHPQLIAREDLARRMKDEARSLAKLQHPNIVEVITAGVTKDALKMPFYVMERLIGQNLRTVLEKRGALDPMHAFRVAIDVAEALEHAHENAIVHRDVKPENIFLHRNANGGTTTKLLDFGIVRLLDRKASHTHGKFIGTLRYASPEQISGREIGPQTDIYSLGAVLYEMLCGRGPFDDMGDAYAIGAAHATMAPPSLSRFMHVSPDVDRTVLWALAKEPAQRPRDAFTFAVEVRRLLQIEEAKPRIETVANVLAAGAGKESVVVTPPLVVTECARTSDAAPTPVMNGTPPTRNERAVNPIGPTVIAASPPSMRTREAVYAPPGVVVRVSAPPVDALSARAAALSTTAAFAPPTTPSPGVAPRIVASAGPVSAGPAPAPRGIDRSAPTRPSPLIGGTHRMPNNDTQIESVRPMYPPVHEPVWDGAVNVGNVTGPLAGEANTRPPADRGPRLLVAVAALAAIVIVGGAGAFVKLRGHASAGTRASVTVEAPASPPPVAIAQLTNATPTTPPVSTATATATATTTATAPPSTTSLPAPVQTAAQSQPAAQTQTSAQTSAPPAATQRSAAAPARAHASAAHSGYSPPVGMD